MVLTVVQIHQQTQYTNHPNGESRRPQTPHQQDTTCPHGIRRLYRIDKCEPSNCTTINLLANRVQRSKFNICATELQGKPARRWCPPGTLTDKVQAYQSIWGLQVLSQSNPSTISWDSNEITWHSTTSDKALAPVSQEIKGTWQMELDTTCNPSAS